MTHSNSNGNSNGTENYNQGRRWDFLDLARLGAARGASSGRDLDDVEEETPSELNTINSSGGFLVVSTDKLSVKYTGVNLHGHDVGVVQANKPAPVKRLVYYFEIFVKDAGTKGQIAIGFTTETFKMRRQPGWEANSCGYHGDDGLLYRGQGKGEAFGPTYTANDIVGAGINYTSQEFFFTKNGALVGTVYKDIKGPLFPTIAVHSQNEEWEANSCGYHGDDGLLYRGQGKGEAFGPTYTANDIVGAGINYTSQEFFFTKNGALVGTVYKDIKGPLFPTIAVHSQNEEWHSYALYVFAYAYNLCWQCHKRIVQAPSPFIKIVSLKILPVFSYLEDFEKQERMKQQTNIEKISLPPNVSYGIVRSYLLHYGYEDTLNLFDMASKTTVPPVYMAQENGFSEQDIMYALNHRKTLRKFRSIYRAESNSKNAFSSRGAQCQIAIFKQEVFTIYSKTLSCGHMAVKIAYPLICELKFS
ncbi:hypothetical protein CJ030_MR8G002620 [Morella rubra]|uniref:B30.2/SPRY domain-containing protein n=2 Tax=Morella rubra TaxID=262757 RepID=A0A6A1UYC0_9ROSI|nr:hypothetical protein CJ030_MR8G002620 [Morella rubra]